MLALSAILILLLRWRQQSSFEHHAFWANALLMIGGFMLAGYQLTGYFVSA